MAIDTKLNLNNNKFEQWGVDTLHLSGCTKIFGQIDSNNGYQISGTTILKTSNKNIDSIFLGNSTGVNSNNIGIDNVGIGTGSLGLNVNGSYNYGIGTNSIHSNITGLGNVGIGYSALFNNISGSHNVGNGYQSLFYNTIGSHNVANGYKSLYFNSEGNSNIANGQNVLFYNTTGCRNVGIGENALFCNSISNNNVGIGYNAGFSNITGSSNVFLGNSAGYSATTSNKLYIANNSTTNLIYGDFLTNEITIPKLKLSTTPTTGLETDGILVWNSVDKQVKQVGILSTSSKWEDDIDTFATTIQPRWDSNTTYYGIDEFNFNALPSGYRDSDGTYVSLSSDAYFWSATEFNSTNGYGRYLNVASNLIYGDVSTLDKNTGYSVRCLRDIKGNEATLPDGTIISNAYIDIDNNIYDGVKIGTQVWIVENLKTTKYITGNTIPTALNDGDWSTDIVGAYAVYPYSGVFTGETAMIDAYGLLYNWYAITNIDGLVLSGVDNWHIPTTAEWSTLTTYLESTYIDIDNTNIAQYLKSRRQVDNPYTIEYGIKPKLNKTVRADYITGLDKLDAYLKIDQTIPQTISGGRAVFSEGIKLGKNPAINTFEEGEIFYDAEHKTMSAMIDTNITLQIGQEDLVLVYNNTGVDIQNGKMVYPTGAFGDMLTVALAKADAEATSLVIGMSTQLIPKDDSGFVANRGIVHDLNTSGYTSGQIIYLSPYVDGETTSIAPTDTAHYVVKVGVPLIIDPITGSTYIRTIQNNRLTDLGDVAIDTPIPDQVLKYNGIEWINGSVSTSGVGPGISFFGSSPYIISGSTNNTLPILTLSKTPVTTTEKILSATLSAGTTAAASWLYNSALGRTIIDAGVWNFLTYCAVDSTGGGRVTTITRQVYDVLPFTLGTVTTTGTGTSRTATASADAPFATTKIAASATNTVASYLQTPQGLYQITARASDTVVTILVPTTYVNENAVSISVWKKLFGVTSAPITSIIPNYSLVSDTVSQGSFIISTTSKLGVIPFVTTNNTITIGITYDGTTRNSHITTPLSVLHNEISGLNGGAGNEYYHLTLSQYTIATQAATAGVSGYLSLADWNTFNTKEPAITKNTAFNKDFETSTANIKMNDGVSVGVLSTIARADHIHPSDSTKAYLSGATFTGDIDILKQGGGLVKPIFSSYTYSDTLLSGGYINSYHAGGGLSSPTATLSGMTLMEIGSYGYDTAQWSTTPATKIKSKATQTWTTIANGADITFGVTKNNTLGNVDVLKIENDGTLSSLITNYETLVLNDNDIPNKKYVDGKGSRLQGYSTTPTATSTTTLTAASNYMQYFTGTLGQIIVMPVVSTLVLGFQFKIVNNSTGILTINSSGSNLIISLQTGCEVILTCIAITGTGVASWSVEQKLPALTTDKIWLGVNNIPTETDTAVSALFVGDYTNDFPALITASNWVDNVTNATTGQLGDRAIGVDELGSISESFFTQYGWTRDFINSFITDVTLIAALETSGNWTPVSDVLSTYNAAKGDKNQTFFANGIFYFCYGTASHTWIRYGNLPFVQVTDPTYMTMPQIEVGKLDNSTIVIEAKFDVIGVTLKAETATAGNISIGSADGLSDIVAVTALPTTIGQRKQLLYIVNPDYPTTANRTLYVTIDSAASVELTILTQKMFD